MRFAPFGATAGLLHASSILAQSTSTAASSVPSCTASLISEICDYPSPGPEFAVAIESRASCWEYCDSHPPCSFVIFAAGNPTTGSGTCWLYPGKTYDASAASSDCGNPSRFVYDKPTCSGGATPTGAGCVATATPSAIAEVCDYPTPPDNCFNSCTASEGAVDCLSQCAQADECSFVVFNPHNPSGNPYASGTCWMYPNGTYAADAAGTCSGAPEQYVYHNLCPKPSPSLSAASSPSSTASGNSDGSGLSGAEAAAASAAASASASLSRTDQESRATRGLSPLCSIVVGAFVSIFAPIWRTQ